MLRTKLQKFLGMGVLVNLILIVGIMLFASSRERVENLYSQIIFPRITGLLRTLSGSVEFNAGEVFILVCLIFAVIVAIFAFLERSLLLQKKKQVVQNMALSGGLVLTTLYIVFLLLWGLNYHRIPVAAHMNLPMERVKDSLVLVSQVEEMAIDFIARANYYRKQMELLGHVDSSGATQPKNLDSLLSTSPLGYQIMSQCEEGIEDYDLQNLFIKSPDFSEVLSYTGTSGIYNIFTGEANLNKHQPAAIQAFVSCHELAHQIGVSPENEANFLGFLCSVYHPDPYFKYSGYLKAVSNSLGTLKRVDSLRWVEVKKQLDEDVKKDYRAMSRYWKGYRSWLQDRIWDFYDLYLRSNRQKDGIKSYGLMFKLMAAKRLKEDMKSTIHPDGKCHIELPALPPDSVSVPH